MDAKSISEDAPRRPPAYGYPDDNHLPKPDLVLLEKYGYFADRDNATTASCEMRGLGGTIKVTFCTARPPRVSYFCVHATAFNHTDFAIEPHVLATEGGLVLLRVVVGRPPDLFRPYLFQYLVYDAGTEGRRPSLKHLPHPGRYEFSEFSVALVRHGSNHRHDSTGDNFTLHLSGRGRSGFTLRPHAAASNEDHDCGDCNYVIAAERCGLGKHMPPDLCLYHSETETWSVKPVTAPETENTSYRHHFTNKAITIGGEHGIVGWVDLWQDILFCDVLASSPKLRRVNLPPPITASGRLGQGNPRSVRDVAVIDGSIQYTELQVRIVPGSYTDDGDVTFDGWKAARWSMKITESLAEAWHRDYELDSSEISESSLPKLQVDADTAAAQPTLQRLHIGLPNLSLQDDGIVYFLTKIDYRDKDHTAWVLAVDMRKKTIHEVAEFGAQRTIGLAQGYFTSRISKYLKVAPGTKREQKRQGMRLMGSSSKKQHGMSMATNVVCFPGQPWECDQSQQDTQVEEGAEDMVLE